MNVCVDFWKEIVVVKCVRCNFKGGSTAKKCKKGKLEEEERRTRSFTTASCEY